MAVTKKKTAKPKVAKKTGSRTAKASTTATRTKPRAAATKTTAKKNVTKTTKAAAPKKATAVKLNDRQREYLKKIKDAGETGYEAGPSYEQRTIDALVERKLVKRGAKDKTSGKHRFTLTKTGEKQLTTPPPAAPAS